MASVRLSNEIRTDILRKAKSLFDKEIQEAENSLAPDFGERAIYAIIPPEFTALMANSKADKNWFPKVGEMRVKFGGIGSYELQFMPKHVPYNLMKNRYSDAFVFPGDHALTKEYGEYKERKEQAHKNKNDFADKVEGILESANTVKQFLDAWPGGRRLLPDYVIERMHEKTDVETRAKNEARQLSEEEMTVLNKTLVTKAITE